jgi:hypothetical protein
LHDFRSISLHPIDPESVGTGFLSGDEYIQLSARLSLAFKKLENIATLDEKVIIVVHNRRLRTLLSRLIQNKFGCPKPEYIRGDTVPGQRQEIVDRFSSLKGFAALVLSGLLSKQKLPTEGHDVFTAMLARAEEDTHVNRKQRKRGIRDGA